MKWSGGGDDPRSLVHWAKMPLVVAGTVAETAWSIGRSDLGQFLVLTGVVADDVRETAVTLKARITVGVPADR